MSTLEDGIYVLTNKASKTSLDLNAGGSANGTPVYGWADSVDSSSYYNKNWLVKSIPGTGAYNIQNVRGGTFLDLSGGSSANGTPVQGWSAATGSYVNNQLWVISAAAADGTRRITNKGTNASLEISNGSSENGTRAQTWQSFDIPAQAWFLEKRDRSSGSISTLLLRNQYLQRDFKHYLADGTYIVCPREVMEQLCATKGIKSRTWTAEVYDCDDFSYSMKAAVGEWAYENVKVPVAVICGVMYGNAIFGNDAHAYNWVPMHDWSAIKFFEPQDGQFKDNIGYNAYFGLY